MAVCLVLVQWQGWWPTALAVSLFAMAECSASATDSLGEDVVGMCDVRVLRWRSDRDLPHGVGCATQRTAIEASQGKGMPRCLARRPMLTVLVVLAALLPAMCGAASAAHRRPAPGHTSPCSRDYAAMEDVRHLRTEARGLPLMASPAGTGSVTACRVAVPGNPARARRFPGHGLAEERSARGMRVASAHQGRNPRQEPRRDPQVGRPVEPTVTLVVPVNYRDATELSVLLERHLGACASVSADARTNTVILTETPSCLQRSQPPAP